MKHHNRESRLHRGFYTKLRAFAAYTFPRTHRQPSCSRLYRRVSTSTTSLNFDADSDSDAEKERFVVMGKSNKFDYTNRPNSGEKLGHIVGRDLEKEADKMRKDAERLASKARKVSIGSGDSSSAVSSAESKDGIAHALDIKLPGKQLGNDGACALFDGLEIALSKGTNEASVLLEDLNLADNAITTASLARLAPIIVLAQYTLKTLDLSKNNIKVNTIKEVLEWKTFLQSFKCCHKLRRLDLSGNVELGSKALEVFARVYIAAEDITAIPAGGMASVQSLADKIDSSEQETPRSSSFIDPMTSGGFLQRRCGLRSIPYITLSNVGLTDAGALWLSYVIEDHHYPNQLMSELNATPADSTIRAYQQTAQSSGIEWDVTESGLSRDGKSLLDKAERIRRQTMLSDQVTVVSLELIDEEGADGGHDELDVARRGSVDHRNQRAPKGDRRASLRSIHTTDGGEHEMSELESARRKIQRSVLQQYGVSSVELWCTGLRIATAAQILSGLGPCTRRAYTMYTGPPLWEFQDRRPTAMTKQPMRPATPANGSDENRTAPAINELHSPDGGPRRQGTYAATLTANTGATAGEPELAITEVTNSPSTPKLIFKPHRKCAFSDGGDLLAQKLDALQFRSENGPALSLRMDTDNNSPLRFVRWQEERMQRTKDGTNAFRNSQVVSHLPVKVVKQIARETLTKRERELLSAKQRRNAVLWGFDRANFASLKEWRKMADSSQAWLLLESIGCLAYQRE